MYGCTWQKGIGLALGCLLLAQGCTDPEACHPHGCREKTATKNTLFDRSKAGTIRGQVTWHGEIPSIPPFQVRSNWPLGTIGPPGQVRENPHVPRIDSHSRGVADAVVFLRGVDPARARPWDLPPVRVEMRGRQFHIYQGEPESQIGFVHRGAAVTMLSRDQGFHSLHAGSAAFFTLAFPDPDEPSIHRFSNKGLVDLTSAAGYYWMRGYLFVDDHPYYDRTDRKGMFTLAQVPPGRYELVCWLPNWHVERQERDPESSLPARLYFAPPVEIAKAVTVKQNGIEIVDFTLDVERFCKREKKVPGK
jgi:hypothetical protein